MVKTTAQPGWMVIVSKSLLSLMLLAITILPINQIVFAQEVNAEPPATGSQSSTPATPKTSEDYRSGFPVLKYLTTEDPNPTNVDKDGKLAKQEHSYLCTGTVDQNGICQTGEVSNPIGAFVLQAINFLVLIASSLAFLVVVVAGFMWLISTGNENLSSKAKEILGQAALGLVITLSAYFIISFVQSLLFETL